LGVIALLVGKKVVVVVSPNKSWEVDVVTRHGVARITKIVRTGLRMLRIGGHAATVAICDSARKSRLTASPRIFHHSAIT